VKQLMEQGHSEIGMTVFVHKNSGTEANVRRRALDFIFPTVRKDNGLDCSSTDITASTEIIGLTAQDCVVRWLLHEVHGELVSEPDVLFLMGCALSEPLREAEGGPALPGPSEDFDSAFAIGINYFFARCQCTKSPCS